ncbi:hypothetical protein Aduo_015390 [Ancylostoma duodenale]
MHALVGFREEGKIFVSLSQHRDTIFVVFGILCLLSWLAFNLYAVREYFCPFYYHHIKTDANSKIIDECYRKFRLTSALSSSVHSGKHPSLTTSELDVFIV